MTEMDGSGVASCTETRTIKPDDVELIWAREQQRIKQLEAIQDKFATLFEPPTPRASPTLGPPPLLSRVFRPTPDSTSLVGVLDDPLSFTPGDATPSAVHDASFKTQPLPHSNFFDMFTYDAKQRSSAARSQVLDELLLHEDDPMWFVLDREINSSSGPTEVANPDPPSLQPTSITPSKHSDDTERQPPSQSVLLDIDHDYFRPSPAPSSHPSPRSLSPILHRMPSRSSSIPPPTIAPPIACSLTASPPPGHYHEFDPLVDNAHTKPPITSVKEVPDSSIQAPALYERSSSLSSKLMSSLLRGAQPSPPSSPSSKLADTRSTTLDHPEDHTSASTIDTHHPVDDSRPPPPPPAVSSTVSEGRLTQFSVSKRRIPFAPAIVTHSTSPFAPTFYNSPSGAPGFKGDRYDWDKGFSDALESEWKKSPFASADVHDHNGSGGNGDVSGSVASSSVVSGSRGGWGTGFGFGFGTIRAGKSKSHTPSPSSSILAQGDELNAHGQEGRNIPPVTQSDRADHDSGYNRHERLLSSTPSTDTGSPGGMGDLIERKVGTIELVGRKASSDSVLMPELASMLHAHLPALSRLPRSWRLLYSLDQHGISLNTLYSRCEAHLSQNLAPSDLGVSKGMLLAIKDGDEHNRAMFGAWIAEGLKLNKGKGYSGGGESFLWKYVDGILKVFKATGRNNYVALCEPDYISFGGGDGHYGLYLDDTLFEGSSASCPTFDNEPLCTGPVLGNLRSVKFECLGLEVWGMA